MDDDPATGAPGPAQPPRAGVGPHPPTGTDPVTGSIGDLESMAPTAELDPLNPTRPDRSLAGLGRATRRALPGLGYVAVVVSAAFAVNRLVPSLSPLVIAVGFGALLANLHAVPPWAVAGTHLAAKRLLRVGVVLLGFQLAAGDVLQLGPAVLVVVVVTVAATFLATQWLGHRLGLSPSLSLLIATGFSICGASAVAAVDGVTDADEEEVAFAIALVTLCGSLAIVALPALRGLLGLGDATAFGSWVGASVHDVGQVVATAANGGPAAIRSAVIVKLTRVVLLAPMVAGIGLARRRQQPWGRSDTNVDAAAPTTPLVASVEKSGRRLPILPLFVVGFLAAIAIRSVGLIPAGRLELIKNAQDVCLAAALVGLGTGVHLAKLRRVGGRPLILGAASWAIIATVSYFGVLMTH